MIKKILLLLTVFSLAIAFSFYLRTKTLTTTFDESYKKCQTVDLYNSFEAFYPLHPRPLYLDDYENIDSIDDLFEKSDVIVTVKYHSRAQKHNVIETDVTVLDCYKGNVKKNISVYEPAFIRGDLKEMFLYQSTPLMKENEMYLLFLKEAISNNYYNLTNNCLAMYSLKKELTYKQFKVDDRQALSLPLSQIVQLDYMVIDYSKCMDLLSEEERKAVTDYQNHIRQYEQYHMAIFERLNIEL